MEEYIKTISVPAIAAAVYFVMKLIRHAAGGNKKFERFIPLMSAGLGVIFGVVCFFALPAIIPADNVVIAIVIGGASGFTAIGTDQMLKQFGEKPDPDQIAESKKISPPREEKEPGKGKENK